MYNNYKINDIEAAKLSKGRQNDDLRDMAADDDEDDKKDQEEEVEEQDEKEVIVKLQEQLDEIRTNMTANNGRLDDAVLNKLLNIYTSQVPYTRKSFSMSFLNDVCSSRMSRMCIFGKHCSHCYPLHFLHCGRCCNHIDTETLSDLPGALLITVQ